MIRLVANQRYQDVQARLRELYERQRRLDAIGALEAAALYNREILLSGV